MRCLKVPTQAFLIFIDGSDHHQPCLALGSDACTTSLLHPIEQPNVSRVDGTPKSDPTPTPTLVVFVVHTNDGQ
jgi:hypothetical protein